MYIDTFVGYAYPVQRHEEDLVWELDNQEERLIPLEDFIPYLIDDENIVLLDALEASDVTDVLLLRGW